MRILLTISLFLPLLAGAQLHYGVRVGANKSEMTEKYTRYRPNPRSIMGFQAGISLDYESTPNLFVYAQPMITLSGGKWFFTEEMIRAETGKVDKTVVNGGYQKCEIYSLRLPVGLKYSIDMGGFRPFISGAPYLDLGLLGFSKADWNSYKPNVYANDWGALNRISYGVSFALGMGFKKLVVSVDYQNGLSNMGRDGMTVKMNTVMLSVGYNLGIIKL